MLKKTFLAEKLVMKTSLGNLLPVLSIDLSQCFCGIRHCVVVDVDDVAVPEICDAKYQECEKEHAMLVDFRKRQTGKLPLLIYMLA